MNRILMGNIVRHIFSNFAVIPSSFVNINNTKSLMSKDFLINETLSFEGDDGDIIKNNIWGCQISSDEQEVKILLGDCSQDNIKEYCLIVHMKNSPAYGISFICNENNDEALIACTVDNSGWMECKTFLQATFLAGMEQIRDIGLVWNRCTNCKVEYDLMISFIDFHTAYYEDLYNK